ncbi:hypothetical protein ABIC08_008406 [Bradyrhizobium sp. RT9b]
MCALGPAVGNGHGEGTACHASQNILILWGLWSRGGFSGQSWLTFRQALSLGGHVRKGERGTTVVYADRFVPEEERKRAIEAADEAQEIPILKRKVGFSRGEPLELYRKDWNSVTATVLLKRIDASQQSDYANLRISVADASKGVLWRRVRKLSAVPSPKRESQKAGA